MPAKPPYLSLVVPSYRRAGRVERAVNAWAAQRLERPLELIVVDDGSDDGTAERLQEVAEADPRVRVLRQSHRGLAASRNAGLDEARGRFICFVDDDIRPREPGVLARWLGRAEREGGAWVARMLVPDDAARTPVQRAWRERLERGPRRWRDGRRLGVGGFWFAALLIERVALHGERFDERFAGYGWEEMELGYRLHGRGVHAALARDVEVWHDDPVTLVGLERKHEAYGCAGWSFARAHPRLAVRVWTGTWGPVRWGKRLLGVEARGLAAFERVAALADDPAAATPAGFDRDLRAALEGAYARGVRLGGRGDPTWSPT